MKNLVVVMLLFWGIIHPLFAQNSIAGWEKWEYMLGEWAGEGSGQPGSGNGTFTLKTKLGGSILERKGKTEMAATSTRPAMVHEDVMIIYKNREGNPTKSIYFDNENHVINYDITYSENKIVMTSEISSSMPRFRLIYEKLTEKEMNIRFEMAMPNAPEEFRMYLEGKSRKVD